MNQEKDVRALHIPSGLSVFSADLIEMLREAVRDGKDMLTDEEMTVRCGKATSVNGAGYSNLQTAMRYVLRNDGIHWERVKGANCIKHQQPAETLTVAESNRKRIHRMSRSSLQKMATIKPEALPANERAAINAKVAQLKILDWMSSPNTSKKIEARTTGSEPVSLPQLLDALKK